MSEQHMDAGEVDESEEVFDVAFPSRDESSEVVHPGEEAFDFPALLIATELAPVLVLRRLRRFGAIISMPYSSRSFWSSLSES